MEKQTNPGCDRPEDEGEPSNAAPEREKTVDEKIQEMLEENRLAQIETSKYVREVAKRLWTRTR